MKKAIIIMAKAPLAGQVKTRLQPNLTSAQCAALAECFLRDTIKKAETLQNQLIIAYSPAEKRSFFDEFASRNILLNEQTGDDLGARMYHAFDFAFRQNSEAVVMIGTDSPTLPPEFLSAAFSVLETADCVLGKTDDGGFYLIGLCLLKREIFENVVWSSPETYAQTKENILRAKLKLKEISIWYDVDTPEDLRKLAQDFEQNELSRKIAPITFEWIRKDLLEKDN